MPTSPSPLTNSTLSHNPNATYFTDEDMEDIGFTEMQTVVLACILTLLPLVLGLVSYFGVRFCWGRLKGTTEAVEAFGKGLDREASSDRNKSSHVLLPEQMKPSDSQFSVIPVEEIDEALTSYSSGNHTSKSTANGSIITMTMKNNHLIVETEERVLEGSGGEGNSVFVVDVEANEEACDVRTAIIHQAEEDDEIIGPSTGLSQSDLSASSNGSNNPTYSYGNQVEYTEADPPTGGGGGMLKMTTSGAGLGVKSDEDELYQEQQRRLGNEMPPLELSAAPPPPPSCGAENPAFLPTPDPAVVSSS